MDYRVLLHKCRDTSWRCIGNDSKSLVCKGDVVYWHRVDTNCMNMIEFVKKDEVLGYRDVKYYFYKLLGGTFEY